MRALRLLVALSAACAVLLGGAWAGGAFAKAGAGKAPRGPADPGYTNSAGEIGVGDALEVSGQPMQLSLFYTSDAPLKVIGFYADAFQARGVMPIATGDNRMAHVAGFDPHDGMQRFITAIPQPDGNTLVMVGVTNPRKPPKFVNAANAAGFPVPPENRGFLGYRSDDGAARSESGQYVSSLSTEQLAAFYREKLGALGYAEEKAGEGDSLLYFSKQGETLSVALQKLEQKKGAAVFVNRISGDPR
jgi:hypothetical protein